MKGLTTKLLLFVFTFASFTLFAERMLLTGRPVILIPNGNYYTFPRHYVPPHHHHFVDLSGEPRVCFLHEQHHYEDLDLLRINIVHNNKVFLWYCYRYDKRFFEVDY